MVRYSPTTREKGKTHYRKRHYMKEQAIDARVIGATVKIEICKKVEVKYRRSDKDSYSEIYARALEDSVRDVELTAHDYEEIAAEVSVNRAKRAAKRANARRNK